MASVNPPLDLTASPPEGEGAIAGHVTDSELSPVPGVDVALAGQTENGIRTDEAGAFRLDGIEPGLHTLFFQRFGYSSIVREVRIVPDNVTTLDVVLARVPVLFPYSKVEYFDGYLPFSVAGPRLSWEAPDVGEPHQKTRFKLHAEDGLSTIVSGMTWLASGPASAQRMGVSVVVESVEAGRFDGPNPVTFRLDQWRTRGPAHNVTFTVSLPMGAAENPSEAFNVAYGQRFDLYATLYYNAQAPVDAPAFPE